MLKDILERSSNSDDVGKTVRCFTCKMLKFFYCLYRITNPFINYIRFSFWKSNSFAFFASLSFIFTWILNRVDFRVYISKLNFKDFLSIFDILFVVSCLCFCLCKLYNFHIEQIFVCSDNLSIKFQNFFFFSFLSLAPDALLAYVL